MKVDAILLLTAFFLSLTANLRADEDMICGSYAADCLGQNGCSDESGLCAARSSTGTLIIVSYNAVQIDAYAYGTCGPGSGSCTNAPGTTCKTRMYSKDYPNQDCTEMNLVCLFTIGQRRACGL
jgi:hypothetical protein